VPVVQLIQPVLTKPFHRDGYVYEEKYDGWRVVAYTEGRHVRLVSRRGVDHTERFADIAAGIRRLPARTLILDGEGGVFDEALVSHMHLLMDPPADAVVTPPVFRAFDCLYARGKDARMAPQGSAEGHGGRDRQLTLVLPARRMPDDSLEAWQVVRERGYEGLVAKDQMASYSSSTRWWKVKVRHDGHFVIGGLAITPSGYRGLLLGTRVDRGLRPVGTVEWA
jgi:bifunctional non-homologous end joining protein LigD